MQHMTTERPMSAAEAANIALTNASLVGVAGAMPNSANVSATAIANRADNVSTRDRMRQREGPSDVALRIQKAVAQAEAVRAMTPPLAATYVNPASLSNSPSRAAVTRAAAVHDAAANVDTTGGALTSFDQCRALRDRIYARGAPSAAAAAPAANYGIYEQTKDVYAQDAAFPVTNVVEMERVHTAAAGQPETLLMATESAALVHVLERRLAEMQERCIVAERRTERDAADIKALSDALALREQQSHDGSVRTSTLSTQLDMMRTEHHRDMEHERRRHGDELKAAKATHDAGTLLENKKLQAGAKEAVIAMTEAQRDAGTLVLLVAEMKEQLGNNATALQNHTLTIRQMTQELVAAKMQAASVSLGFQQKEKAVTELRGTLHSQKAELIALKDVSKELKKEQDLRAKADILAADTVEAVEARKKAEGDRDKLLRANHEHEVDVGEKNRELHRLRAQVDTVKTQADAAYLHSAQFRAAAGGGVDTSYAGGVPGGMPGMYAMPPPPPAAAAPGMDELRRAIDDETRRTSEENRRWHAKY
jgi:hypothetical protein